MNCPHCEWIVRMIAAYIISVSHTHTARRNNPHADNPNLQSCAQPRPRQRDSLSHQCMINGSHSHIVLVKADIALCYYYYPGLYLSNFNKGGVDSLGEAKGRQQMTRYLTHQLDGVIPICKVVHGKR